MLNLVETLKELLGVTSNSYDFLFILFSLILILFMFGNLLGLFRMVLGGKRWMILFMW